MCCSILQAQFVLRTHETYLLCLPKSLLGHSGHKYIYLRAGCHCILSALKICCCHSVAKSCLTLCDPMDCSTPVSSVLQYLLEFARIHVLSISDAVNHLILCCPLLLLPSIFPSISVFSNESALCIRWPKVMEFQF